MKDQSAQNGSVPSSPAREEDLPVPWLGMVPAEATEAEAAQVTEPSPIPRRPERPHHSWLIFALVPALILLAMIAHLPLKRAAASLAFPYQLDREEGFVLWQAMEAAQAHSIYPPIDQYPYVVGNYPPVYQLLYGGLLQFAPPSLELGRALVLLSVMIILATLTNMVLRETGRMIAAFLAVTLFLSTWPVCNWIAFARVDLPAMAFGLLGLMAIASPQRRSGFVLGVLFFLVAFFTKQTQVIAPAAAVAGMFWRREWTRAGVFCLTLSVLGAAVFAALNWWTNGEFFRHTVVYNMNEMVPGQLMIWVRHLWFFNSFMLIALLVAIIVALAGGFFGASVARSEHSWRYTTGTLLFPEAFAFLLLSALSISSIAKVGAAANYLLEFHAAAALFIGLVAGELANRLPEYTSKARRLTLAIGGGLFAALLTLHGVSLVFGMPSRMALGRVFDRPPDTWRAEAAGRVELELSEERGEILCEEPVFTIRAGREVLYQPFIMTQLAKEGRWDQSTFVADLRARRFGMIVVSDQELFGVADDRLVPGFTPEMLAAIREHYELYRQIGGYYLYVPRGSDKKPLTRRIANV